MAKVATAGGRGDRAQQRGGRVPADPSTGTHGGSGLTRVTVNLNRQAVEALDTLSASTGYSKTDTINRALQIYALMQAIMDRNGGALVIKHNDGETERVHIV